MVGDNKILTVSYGTFSCTLEGFDDPFSTMKNIAEYFRDLAAGDRFFGAEPPQPDPEMLQSIAEQTIQKRVNAQLSDNNLVLRQDQAVGTPPAPRHPESSGTVAVAPRVAPAAAAPQPGIETVAEKLQRIRAAVSRETAQDALFSEDQHVDEFAAETTAPVTGFTETFEPEIVTEDAAPLAAPQPVAPEAFEEDEAPASEIEAPEVEVSDDDAQEADTPETLPVSAEMPPPTEVFKTPALDVDGETPEADVDVTESAEVAEDQEIDLSEVSSEDGNVEADAEEDTPTAAERQDAAELAVDDVLGRKSDETSGEDETPRRRIIVQKITREDLRAARKQAEAEAAEASEDDSDDILATPAEGILPPEHEEELLREIEALKGDAIADAVEDDAADVTEDAETEDHSGGAEDDDADIDLELALSDLVSEDASEYKKAQEETARNLRLARRTVMTEEHEADVERLISTTTSRIDNDESSNRRASIAHLKAAVAATKADSSLTEDAEKKEALERDQYAEDLARVVRPERKSVSSERSKTDRPAPLVLVSELRIDKDDENDGIAAEETAPVMPRRVSRADLDAAETSEAKPEIDDASKASFAEYAQSANALELPDLLEAAAAYYTYVESTEQFTRPMLMRKIASISEQEGVSREAGLRSFGTLLREGKLVKGSDGKFVIAKSSRFTPEARYAGE